MKPNRIYTYCGCTIEVTPGGGKAFASRVEIRNDKKELVRSGARQEFETIPDTLGAGGKVIHGITAEVQAQRWIQSLPDIIPAVKPAEPEKKK